MIRTLLIALFSLPLLAGCSKQLPNAEQAQELYKPQQNQVLGNPASPVVIADFFGYNCPYCRGLEPKLKQLVQTNPNVHVVYKEYLLFGQRSELPAAAALAANRQGKYMAMHDAMMSAKHPLTHVYINTLAKKIGLNMPKFKQDINNPVIKTTIAHNTVLSKRLNVVGAPTLFVSQSKILHAAPGQDVPQATIQAGKKSLADLEKFVAKVAA